MTLCPEVIAETLQDPQIDVNLLEYKSFLSIDSDDYPLRLASQGRFSISPSSLTIE